MAIQIAKDVAVFVGLFLSCVSALAIIIKPIRTWIINKISDVNKNTLTEIKDMLQQHILDSEVENKIQNETLLCITRSEITSVYYRYFEQRAFPMYERENLIKLYDSYQNNGGNSYIHTIVQEMLNWKVLK